MESILQALQLLAELLNWRAWLVLVCRTLLFLGCLQSLSDLSALLWSEHLEDLAVLQVSVAQDHGILLVPRQPVVLCNRAPARVDVMANLGNFRFLVIGVI